MVNKKIKLVNIYDEGLFYDLKIDGKSKGLWFNIVELVSLFNEIRHVPEIKQYLTMQEEFDEEFDKSLNIETIELTNTEEDFEDNFDEGLSDQREMDEYFSQEHNF